MNGPEHREVRLPTLERLLDLGWSRDRIVCPSPDSSDKEWRVPKRPSEMAKREAGRSFDGWPVDLAIFESDESAGRGDHVLAIFEFKRPGLEAGVEQLKVYLSCEPSAKYGYWTNGTDSVAVYRLADGTFSEVPNAPLPSPDDNLMRAAETPVTFNDLKTPTEKELASTFERLLNTIAAGDSISTRHDQRLNEVANLLIVKLESDKSGYASKTKPLNFQVKGTPKETEHAINALYREYRKTRKELFLCDDPDHIALTAESIHWAVFELQSLNLKQVGHRAMSYAFQVFRNSNLKTEDGQYFTPARVIRAGTMMVDVDNTDKVIDPAMGTAGFLYEAFEIVSLLYMRETGETGEARTWAHDRLFGVDRDSINVKLARALMVGIGDGSAHAYVGDSLREQSWDDFPLLRAEAMNDDSYSVVLTNPPFGKKLRLSAKEARQGKYTICCHKPGGSVSQNYCDTELGIAFVERAYRLLKAGGRLGIVLPETYFFSASYRWFRDWVAERFTLRGVLNIPMEAFQGFCRAKTNFYVFQKKGELGPTDHQPSWFVDGKVWVSNAPTIGINKDGEELYKVNEKGERSGEIDDRALDDVLALLSGETTSTSRYIDAETKFAGVPGYSDTTSLECFRTFVAEKLPGFTAKSIGDLVKSGWISVGTGHGSPAADLRQGTVPYVKVSDLRAGTLNVNPTNMVSVDLARKFWGGEESGLKAYDIVTPARTSKNIGEPVVILPGQTEVVLTKEVLVFSAAKHACFDNFYLMWALDLPEVKRQWDRVIFMQTNREDVGYRFTEIEIPIPPDESAGMEISSPYRNYYLSISSLKERFENELAKQRS